MGDDVRESFLAGSSHFLESYLHYKVATLQKVTDCPRPRNNPPRKATTWHFYYFLYKLSEIDIMCYLLSSRVVGRSNNKNKV